MLYDEKRQNVSQVLTSRSDWRQIMYRDAVHHDVQLKDWRTSLSLHMVMRGGCLMQSRQRQCSVTNAKSLGSSENGWTR